jgi:hypothetical protein
MVGDLRFDAGKSSFLVGFCWAERFGLLEIGVRRSRIISDATFALAFW